MRAVAVFYVLGWALASIAAAMLVPIVFAIALDSVAHVQAFAVPAIAIGFLAGCMIMAFRSSAQFSGRRQSLLLLALMWTIVPLAAAFPFYASGFPKGAIAAYFEATSGFTTTGATVITKLGETPASIIIWRALLQWLGGLATLVSLAALLGPLSGSVIEDRQLRLIGHAAQGTLQHLREAIASILPLFSALTAACFIVLTLCGIPAFDAFCLSLSALSTGGFMPRDGTIILYGSPLAELALAIFMVVGAISIIWIRAITQFRWSIVRETREPFVIFWSVGLLGLLIAVLVIVKARGFDISTISHSLTLGIATAASLVSTTGLRVSEQSLATVPYLGFLLICIVGGGRFSTAGGLKVHRVMTMLRQVGREMRLLIYPHGVRPLRHGAEALDVEVVKAVWITMTAFMLTIGSVALIVAWSGVPFGGAIMAAAGAVSNMGQVYDFAQPGSYPNAPSYAGMSPASQLALCAGMVFGRFEILSLMGIFLSVFWRD